LTCPKDGGAEARAIPAPAQQNPATYVRTTTRAAAARPRPAVANRPGGHDRRSTRPAACLACAARQGRLPGGARSHYPRWDRLRDRIPKPDADGSRRTERPRGTREYRSDTDHPAVKRSARLNAWASGYGDGPGEGWRTPPARSSRPRYLCGRSSPSDQRPRLAGSCRWRLRCSSGCSRDAVDRQRHPGRGETP
jgi:hypothetical protein